MRKLHASLFGFGVALAVIAWMGGGCAVASYHENLAAGSPKPAGYPIPVYTPEMRIPRPCEVIGTVSVNAGKFTMFGGSPDAELKKIMRSAHEKGADVVRFVSVDKPDFLNPNYRITADLLRYTDAWEIAPVSRAEFQDYLRTHRNNLDPIEGLWLSTGSAHHSVGIMRNNSKPGRDFIGFMVTSLNPAWPFGTKKMDVRRGPQPDTYVLTYYMDDYERREIPIILTDKRRFSINFRNENDETIVFYTKDFNVFNGQ